MKVGDYVVLDDGRPGGLLVSKLNDNNPWLWNVLMDCGGVELFHEDHLEVVNESR